MTLQQLKYALTIARSASINEAAKQLFISQPSLSETIRELESEVGFDIFLRSNRGIVITPEGEEFLSYAGQVTERLVGWNPNTLTRRPVRNSVFPLSIILLQ